MQSGNSKTSLALAVDDGGGGTGVALGLLPALDVEGLVDAVERAVVSHCAK